ncbi:MAG: hypothetical protein PWP38_2743 [Clostridiales bacterium]|jgi:hypothetical protein|nr:hypothetical protein [Clostridiales bacterium]
MKNGVFTITRTEMHDEKREINVGVAIAAVNVF